MKDGIGGLGPDERLGVVIMGLDNDLEKASAGKIADLKWPSGFLLSQTAFDRFRNQSIPIPTTRLRQVAHNCSGAQ